MNEFEEQQDYQPPLAGQVDKSWIFASNDVPEEPSQQWTDPDLRHENSPSQKGQLIHDAVKDGSLTFLKAQLMIPPTTEEINWVNEQGYTSLHVAIREAERNKFKLVKRLLNAGALVNARTGNDDGYTALHIAIREQNKIDKLKIVEKLLTKGADINARTYYGETPLDLATRQNNQSLIDLLEKTFSDLGPETTHEDFHHLPKNDKPVPKLRFGGFALGLKKWFLLGGVIVVGGFLLKRTMFNTAGRPESNA